MPHYCKAAQHRCIAIIRFASGRCFTSIGKLVSLQAAVQGLGGEGPFCLPMEGPAGPGMSQMRGSSHRLSFAGLCKTWGPDLRTVYLLCLSPGISESQPTAGDYVSLGIYVEIQPSACSQGTCRQLGAESGSRVNLVLPGKAGSAPWAACAWGLSHCRGPAQPRRFVLSRGVSPGAGRCLRAEGGWWERTSWGPRGSPLLCISSSNRSQVAKGSLVEVEDVSVPGNQKLCCFRREPKTAPGHSKAPACSWSLGPVLPAGAGWLGEAGAGSLCRGGSELPPQVSGEL